MLAPTLTQLRAAARSDLNNAVYMFEARLNALVAAEEAEGKAPFAFEVDYGERAEHCWNGKAPRCCWHLGLPSPQSEPAFSSRPGDQENGNHISRLRYNTMYISKMMGRIDAAAPPNADTTSWRY